MSDSHDRLYAEHLATLCRRYDEALELAGYEAVIVGAGGERRHFLDDQGPPFRPNAFLQQWFPAVEHPGACLLYRPGERPVAVLCRAEDFWHRPPDAPGAPWSDHLDFRVVGEPGRIADALPEIRGRSALLEPEAQWSGPAPAGSRNPPSLIAALQYHRAVKTSWEIERLRAASRSAAAGHRAAARAFQGGADEFDVLLAFLGASRHTASELPYPAIVATDRHAATLHYQHYSRNGKPSCSLLIDAGCEDLGYASDVTRTHALPAAAEFSGLIEAMDRLQQALCKRVAPGLPFGRLHHAAHVLLGSLLAREGLVDASPEAIVGTGVTRLFFPHGLGHLIGLQVHDVGGHMADPGGHELKAPDAYPKLRLLRTLEPGFALTIEPGLYFIDSLLDELARHELAGRVDWARIERLRACGGIRIEDDLLVTAGGSENLSRDALAA